MHLSQLSLQIIGQKFPVGDPMCLITLKLFTTLPHISKILDGASRSGSLNKCWVMSKEGKMVTPLVAVFQLCNLSKGKAVNIEINKSESSSCTLMLI